METLIRIINKLPDNIEVFAVGGFARDLILKRKCGDIDLAVDKNAFRFAQKVAKTFKSKAISIDDANETYRIMLGDCDIKNIDISLIEGKNIEEDLLKRDFTVNAVAFKLNNFDNFLKHLIMPDKAWLKDFKAKIIKTVSRNSFKKDPLRMLRAFRFAAELGFKISPETLKQIKKDVPLIKKAAPEMVKNEFFRVLSSSNAASLLALMDKFGLLAAIFPEVKNMKAAKKKFYYHPGGLFEHSFETLSAAEQITGNFKKYFPDSADDLQKHFANNEHFSENVTRAGILKFVALFHDNAKPETAKKEGDKIRFFGHEKEGGKKLESMMKNLKMGKKDISAAVCLTENHMRPSTLTKNKVITKKAALKLFRDLGSRTPEDLILAMADWHSYKRLKVFSPAELKKQEKAARWLMGMYFEQANAKPLPKIIDGNIIMKEFGLKPGPWVGELLNTALLGQKEGKITDTKAALTAVSKKLTQIKKKYNINGK